MAWKDEKQSLDFAQLLKTQNKTIKRIDKYNDGIIEKVKQDEEKTIIYAVIMVHKNMK